MPLKKQERKERFQKIIGLMLQQKNKEAYNELVGMCGQDTGLFILADYDKTTTEIKKKEMFRSSIFSILKCGFGWNGCVPDECADNEWEHLIDSGFNNNGGDSSIAQQIADDIYEKSGATYLSYFRKRIDGKENNLLPTALMK